ncbi:MAG: transposase [Endozoicomonadaceae bacterium]|nr:transposase [Endozoicomonadaceae bacterium]
MEPACKETQISLRTYRRWVNADGHVRSDRQLDANRSEPKNKLSTSERQRILEIGCLPEYASLPQSQIVPSLLDKGVYMASEASFYRALKANNQLHRRGRSRQPRKKSKAFEEQCFRSPLVLHSDNGAPMKAQTMKAKLEELGIISSYIRPRVSNDNPYSEALFRTLKYRTNWPSTGFDSFDKARDWVQVFVNWYNNNHKHSKINFVTPSQRHAKQDRALLARRKIVLEKNKATTPS